MDDGRTVTGEFARRFFAAGVAMIAVACGMTALLHGLFPPTLREAAVSFPPVFAATTVLLVFVSGALVQALKFVRREKQRPFRRSLFAAMLGGILFVGFQSYGLRCLLANRPPIDAQTGALAFAFVFVAMHAVHVTVALLFLLFVTMRAKRDRYDHEYYWGVMVAGLFWHALGIAWLAILFVIVISTG